MSEYYPMRESLNSKQGLKNLIDYINNYKSVNNLTIVEIGSYVGESTIIFAQFFKKVISIDPYIDNYDPTDHACKYAPFDQVYNRFIFNTKNFPNIDHIRKTSEDAINDFLPNSIDFVYIDGNHKYEFVKKDIQNYWKIVKPGGFLGGHDYHSIDVKKAIEETINYVDHDFVDRSWVKRKSLDK